MEKPDTAVFICRLSIDRHYVPGFCFSMHTRHGIAIIDDIHCYSWEGFLEMQRDNEAEWTMKGATLSHISAMKEFDITVAGFWILRVCEIKMLIVFSLDE
ncbi:MAG: hypothetical protein JW795_13545 [Chitinivibrionales bacterium]|nr:hypothetical protein [Chitinivibrionales bacterium]